MNNLIPEPRNLVSLTAFFQTWSHLGGLFFCSYLIFSQRLQNKIVPHKGRIFQNSKTYFFSKSCQPVDRAH